MSEEHDNKHHSIDRFSQAIGHSRFIVLLAVAAVMLVAVSLFLLGTIQAVSGVWRAWREVLQGNLHSTELTIQFLEIVSVMLKAVVFYLIGVGLYSLFVSPLNITVSLGVETLTDLESKVVSVVIVILSITFLEHFVRWEEPLATIQFGAAMSLVIVALVLFQRYNHQVKADLQSNNGGVQAQAQREMFERDQEKARLRPEKDSRRDATDH